VPVLPASSREITPWEQCKSPRGRPKHIRTDGQYCDNPHCNFYRVREAHLHALVGDGTRGKRERIPWFRCQACGNRFSQRRHTAMRALKMPLTRVREVVTALGEGVDQAAASRIFNHHPTTIARWRDRFAALDTPLHQRYFRQYSPRYVQLDELKAKVRHPNGDDIWLWIAFDVETKLQLVYQIGPRSQRMANALIHQLKHMLPNDCVPLFSSDGLRMYFYALTAHFGAWLPPPEGKRKRVWQVDSRLLFAQLLKVKSGYRLKYLKTRLRCGNRETYRATLQALGFSGLIETAFIERLNLTLRELIAPLSRRTWSIADNPQTLALHVGLGRVYYHFCRPHESLEDLRKSGRFRRRTPAMAAGVVNRPFRVEELLMIPI
jgi:IS1 family transposase